MTRKLLLSLSAAALTPALYAGPNDPVVAPAPAPPATEPSTVFGTTWFDELKAKKDASGLPITLGAWHWFRFGSDGPGTDGYGIPGLRGTYYWTIDIDPKFKIDGPFLHEAGLHAQIRLREQGTFRPFIDDEIWPWEACAYAKTTAGTFKAGQIWKRFGLDWDGVSLAPNVDLYAEYVKWTVDPANGPKVDYEDGYQLILNWRF